MDSDMRDLSNMQVRIAAAVERLYLNNTRVRV
jgi:hypothetical protein